MSKITVRSNAFTPETLEYYIKEGLRAVHGPDWQWMWYGDNVFMEVYEDE